MTKNIAVIDFGTHRIRVAIAKKHEDGSFSFQAYADAYSEGCVRKGVIFNMETAARIAEDLIKKVEKTAGLKIVKCYVNLGGQSLRTVDHVETMTFDRSQEITAEQVQALQRQIENYSHDRYEMLQVDTPIYHINGLPTRSPVGVPALKLDGRFQLIIARPTLRSNTVTVISDKLGLEVEELIISPFALARTFLTEDQKALGCVLVEFGAGCTTVSVYKDNLLKGIRAIPLGGENITRDLTALHISEKEADKVKCKVSAVYNPSDKDTISVNAADNLSTKNLKVVDVSRYIEARVQEIIDNVAAVIDRMGGLENLGAGVMITGGASEQRGLKELLQKKLNLKAEEAGAIRLNDVENRDYVSNPKLHVLYSMVDYANEECSETFTSPAVEPEPLSVEPEVNDEPMPDTTIPASYPEDEIYEEKPLFAQEEMRETEVKPKEKVNTNKETSSLKAGVPPKKKLFRKLTEGFKDLFGKVVADDYE